MYLLNEWINDEVLASCDKLSQIESIEATLRMPGLTKFGSVLSKSFAIQNEHKTSMISIIWQDEKNLISTSRYALFELL